MKTNREVIYEFVSDTGQPVIRKIKVTEEVFQTIINHHCKATDQVLNMEVGGRVAGVLASELQVLH